MRLTLHVARYTLVLLLTAALLVGAALALGHSRLLPYEGRIEYYAIEGPTRNYLELVPRVLYQLDVARGMTEALNLPRVPSPVIQTSPDGRYFMRLDENRTPIIEDRQTGLRHTLPTGLGTLTWSPDSTRLALTFAPDEDFTYRVYLASADGTQMHPVTPARVNFDGPIWSPDGREILVNNSGQLYVIDAMTEQLYQLADAPYANDYQGSHDSSQVAFSARDRRYQTAEAFIQVVNADGTHLRTLLRDTHGIVGWSPASAHLLVLGQLDSPTDVGVIDLSGDPPELRWLTGENYPYEHTIYGAAWHPDGVRVLMLAAFDTGMGYVVIDSISEQVLLTLERGYLGGVSPDGERLAFTPELALYDQPQHELCTVTIGDPASQRCHPLPMPLVEVVGWLP